MVELPPQVQNQLVQYQQLQRQIQIITTQKHQFESQLLEVERAIEELGKIDKETVVYKNIGSLMVKVNDMKQLEDQLTEQKETLTIKIKTLERQEIYLRERFQLLEEQLQKAFGGSGGKTSVAE